MKILPAIALPLLAVLTVPAIRAATYSEAQITRLEKDVKVLKENAAPRTAKAGEKIDAVSSVATGAASRAELMFPDKALTRLGANSRFTLRGQGHTVDLDKGVMLLEVPEKLRDAKVRTAAVTAAITGGTIITEVVPNPVQGQPPLVKIIVVEGVADLSLNKNPGDFVELHAGQMLIIPYNATSIPLPPVDIDLKKLLKTSKLLQLDESTPNAQQVSDAVQIQQGQIANGDLVTTHLVIPGLGTMVQLDNNARLDLLQNFNVQNGKGGNGGGGGGGGAVGGTGGPVFTGLIPLVADTTVIGNGSTVKTDPKIQAYNTGTGGLLISQGIVYHPATDGPFAYFGFGSTSTSDPNLQPFLESNKGDWAAFKFQQLVVNGAPSFVISDSDIFGPSGNTLIQNVILSSVGNINFAPLPSGAKTTGLTPGYFYGPTFDYPDSLLNSLLFYSQNGSVTLDGAFNITSDGQDLAIEAAGPTSDVSLYGTINLYGGNLVIGAGRDVGIFNSICAGTITVTSGRDTTIQGGTFGEGEGSTTASVTATTGNLTVTAARNIHITNSAQLYALSQASEASIDALLSLTSTKGDITIDSNSVVSGTNVTIQAYNGDINVLDSSISATHALKMLTLKPNGTLFISNSTLTAGQTSSPGDLIRLYAGGANGKVEFAGNVTLNSDEVQIAGKTVQVDAGGNVTITQKNARIFADQNNYNVGSFGTISGIITPYGFSDARKPDFTTGGKLGRPD